MVERLAEDKRRLIKQLWSRMVERLVEDKRRLIKQLEQRMD
jgi:hypothetical protein